MNSPRILRNDLKRLIFDEIFQRYSEPKTRRKAFLILETAIQCFDKKGFENVTFVMIARECSLTSPSLRYYFEDLAALRLLCLQYVHLLSQKLVVDTMGESSDAELMLRRYLQAHFLWVTNFASHFRVWLSFLSYSAKNAKDRKLNTSAIHNGTLRICEILALGRQQGRFHHAEDLPMARLIQAVIMGWLNAVVTEDIPDVEFYSHTMIETFMRALK